MTIANTSALEAIAARGIPEFEGVHDVWPRGKRLAAVREAATAYKARFKSAGQIHAVRSIDIATAPYPTATVYLGGQQVGVSEGATWTGNQDIFSGVAEMTCDDLYVVFTGGVAGSIATAIIEGDSYLWTRHVDAGA